MKQALTSQSTSSLWEEARVYKVDYHNDVTLLSVWFSDREQTHWANAKIIEHRSRIMNSSWTSWKKCFYEEMNPFFHHYVVTCVYQCRSHSSDFHVKDFHSIVLKKIIARGNEVWWFLVKLIVMPCSDVEYVIKDYQWWAITLELILIIELCFLKRVKEGNTVCL